jgi:hypothetical protein
MGFVLPRNVGSFHSPGCPESTHTTLQLAPKHNLQNRIIFRINCFIFDDDPSCNNCLYGVSTKQARSKRWMNSKNQVQDNDISPARIALLCLENLLQSKEQCVALKASIATPVWTAIWKLWTNSINEVWKPEAESISSMSPPKDKELSCMPRSHSLW